LIKHAVILLLALALVLSACNGGTQTTTPATTPTSVDASKIPGSTLTTADLQKNVVNALNLYESIAKSGCSNPRIASTEVTQKPAEANGTRVERWTVDRCGRETVAYAITFTPDPKSGGAALAIEREKVK